MSDNVPDPERLFYIEPHDLAGVTYPTTWGCAEGPAIPGPGFFPPWHRDTLRQVRAAAPDVSVHGEVFSPFSQQGNVDPVNTVLLSTPEPCDEDACARVEIAKPGGGYILSTACSVPPHAPPENILALARAAEARGHYR